MGMQYKSVSEIYDLALGLRSQAALFLSIYRPFHAYNQAGHLSVLENLLLPPWYNETLALGQRRRGRQLFAAVLRNFNSSYYKQGDVEVRRHTTTSAFCTLITNATPRRRTNVKWCKCIFAALHCHYKLAPFDK
jgi:hypothetical protein